MVERFLSQTSFVSQEDYRKNLHIRVPENFNFGYDVVDAYAAEQPGKPRTEAGIVVAGISGGRLLIGVGFVEWY